MESRSNRSNLEAALRKTAGALTAFVSFAVLFFGIASMTPEGLFFALLAGISLAFGLDWLGVVDLDRIWPQASRNDLAARQTDRQDPSFHAEAARDPEFRLRRLEGLKASGLVTDEEYQQKRAEILKAL